MHLVPLWVPDNFKLFKDVLCQDFHTICFESIDFFPNILSIISMQNSACLRVQAELTSFRRMKQKVIEYFILS